MDALTKSYLVKYSVDGAPPIIQYLRINIQRDAHRLDQLAAIRRAISRRRAILPSAHSHGNPCVCVTVTECHVRIINCFSLPDQPEDYTDAALDRTEATRAAACRALSCAAGRARLAISTTRAGPEPPAKMRRHR